VTAFLSVVVPAYNEERRLRATLEAILAFLTTQQFDAEVIVVDDGSADTTVEIAESIRASHPQVRIIRNDHRGKGYTVRAGMLLAQGRYILFTDADLAVPMLEWNKLLPAFESGYDIVIGSREGLGARRLGEPRYRHFMGRIFNAVVRLIALGGIQDTQCGFKAFRYDVAQQIFNRVQLYGADAKVVQGAAVTAFDVEVLFLARKFGYRIKEVPVTWQYGAETKVDPIRDSWRNFSDVIRVRWNDLRGRYSVVPALSKKTPGK
jgi:glycosyltransferase involved in cell wall biosynthesis